MHFNMTAVALACAVAGCAAQGTGVGPASIGARAVFGQPPQDVLRTLVAACANAGLSVLSTGDRRLVCGRTLGANEAALAAIRLGAGSDDYREEMRFAIGGSESMTKVQLSHVITARSPDGAARQMFPQGSQHNMTLRQWLYAAGGH